MLIGFEVCKHISQLVDMSLINLQFHDSRFTLVTTFNNYAAKLSYQNLQQVG